jgi:hypothetical protein
MYEGKPTLVETGDFVNMPPGITHYLYDYSPDMCFLEIAMAGTPDGMIPEEAVEPFCDTRRQRPGRRADTPARPFRGRRGTGSQLDDPWGPPSTGSSRVQRSLMAIGRSMCIPVGGVGFQSMRPCCSRDFRQNTSCWEACQLRSAK